MGQKARAPLLARSVVGEELLDALLTPAEEAVLRLLADGLTNSAIGERLGKRPATVKLQVASILRKLGVHSRAAAAVWWVRRQAGQTG